MEELYIKYPDDVETAVFYSLSVLATADLNDKTYSKQKNAPTNKHWRLIV